MKRRAHPAQQLMNQLNEKQTLHIPPYEESEILLLLMTVLC